MQLKRIQFLMIVTYEKSYAVHTIYNHITSFHFSVYISAIDRYLTKVNNIQFILF